MRFTVRRTMVTVACLGVLWLAQCLNPLATVYSPGYSEHRFQRLSIGMAPPEVEAVMGAPLAKAPWGGDTENWMFSEGAGGPFYWGRWVIFTRGKVEIVVSDLFEND